MSTTRYSNSRSTSVESEPEPEPGPGHLLDKPDQVLREFEPHYPTALGGISKMDIERMKFEGLGQYSGQIYYTDDWETKQSATVCHHLQHLSFR
jgi:hypothetical protein